MNFLVHESENSMFFSRAPYVYFYGWQSTNKILVAYLIKKTLPNGLAHHIKQNLKQKSWNDDWATFACGSVSSSLYSFNPETSEFVTLPDMPSERYRHASVAINNQVWLVGGRSLVDDLLEDVDVSAFFSFVRCCVLS